MREVSMLVWREGSGARVERGDRHAPHVAHMVFFSGYVRLHAPDVSRRAPRVVALVRARHLCDSGCTQRLSDSNISLYFNISRLRLMCCRAGRRRLFESSRIVNRLVVPLSISILYSPRRLGLSGGMSKSPNTNASSHLSLSCN